LLRNTTPQSAEPLSVEKHVSPRDSGVGGRRGPSIGPFPSAPPRTVLATFAAHGSPVAGLGRGRRSASRLPSAPMSRSTCRPSPCSRLSGPPSTMTAPSPWASRPLGDPVFPRRSTSERGLGAPRMTLPGLIGRCQSGGGKRPAKHAPVPPRLPHVRRGVGGDVVHRWSLGFGQSRPHHAARVLRAAVLHVFGQSRFPSMLL